MTTAPSVASIVPISLGGSSVRGGLNDHIGGVFYSLGVMDHTCVGTVDVESHLGNGYPFRNVKLGALEKASRL